MTISIRARSGRFIVKNIYVHEKLNIRCIKNMETGRHIIRVDDLHLLLFHILNAAINMVTYKIGHTTPKTQLGGVKEDLLREVYHC